MTSGTQRRDFFCEILITCSIWLEPSWSSCLDLQHVRLSGTWQHDINQRTPVIPLPTRSYVRSPLASIYGHSDNCWRVWRAHQGSEPTEEQETSMWTQTSPSAGSIYSSSVIRRLTGLLQLPYVSSGCHFLSNPFSPVYLWFMPLTRCTVGTVWQMLSGRKTEREARTSGGWTESRSTSHTCRLPTFSLIDLLGLHVRLWWRGD